MSKYAKAVEHNLEGLTFVSTGACPGCEDCGLEDVPDMDDERYEMANEASFSWSQCDSCDSMLGGDRHPAHGVMDDGETLHLDICTDCLFYLNYGNEPEVEAQA